MDDDGDCCEEVKDGALLGDLLVRPTVESLLEDYDENQVVNTEALLFESGGLTEADSVYEGVPFEVPEGHIGSLEIERDLSIRICEDGWSYDEPYSGQELSPGVYQIDDDVIVKTSAPPKKDDWFC